MPRTIRLNDVVYVLACIANARIVVGGDRSEIHIGMTNGGYSTVHYQGLNHVSHCRSEFQRLEQALEQ